MHSDAEKVSIRPYARLLTMLGEQLIKNDRVALVELLKNSYDADASIARVAFVDFSDGLQAEPGSTLVLVDDGDGMTEAVVRDHWLNPATAVKADRKATSPKTTKNRTIQGDKGIGRFAMFKLGSSATIVTRARGSDSELVLDYNLAFLDSDARDSDDIDENLDRPAFLDEVRVNLTLRPPQVFDGANPEGIESAHGTRIEVRTLRSSWNDRMARRVFDDVARLQPLMPAKEFELPEASNEFRVEFWKDDEQLPYRTDFAQRLQDLFTERAVLRVDGFFVCDPSELMLEFDGELHSLRLDDSTLAGLQVHKNYFAQPKDSPRGTANLACGPFSFSFFVFDLDSTSPARHRLDTEEKRLVKEHRIYLYRDGVRVLPYGDPQDDWLQLDVIRGTQAASRVLSNDQSVGFVHISHANNPRLRDKTNREGLLDEGDAYNDFVAVLQTVIAYARAKPYARYLSQKRRRNEVTGRQQVDVTKSLNDLQKDPALPNALQPKVKKISTTYSRERKFLTMRAERTEDLAGVGLSVETASHDILAAGGQALHIARAMSTYIDEHMPSNSHLRTQVDSLVELLSFVTSRLNDVQGLFVSTRQRRKAVDVGEFAERVGRMFRFALNEAQIDFTVTQPAGPLRVKATEAALLQALVNLVDNAIYWLKTVPHGRQIVLQIQAADRRLIVADTGPGVDDTDEPYIFEPFYSGKGDEGKGLGLYIARQVGARNGFEVTLADRPLVLSGANFVLEFGEDE